MVKKIESVKEKNNQYDNNWLSKVDDGGKLSALYAKYVLRLNPN